MEHFYLFSSLAYFCFWLLISQSCAAFNSTTPEFVLHDTPVRGRSKFSKDPGSPSDSRSRYCPRATVTDCESTSVASPGSHLVLECLGTKLPYSAVSLDLLPEVTSLTEMLEIVESLEVLRNIPKCWAVVQPLICAFHLPRCDKGLLDLPSQEMCRVALGPCRLLGSREGGLPAFLNCNDTNTFRPLCKNDVRELKFNTTSTCPTSLVPIAPTSSIRSSFDPMRHYPGLEGCRLPCDTPLFSTDELTQLRELVGWGATLAFILNFFVVATFLVDWGSAARYPALIIFYLNLCCLLTNAGWLIQFIPGARTDVLCQRDGTARSAEPSAGGNLTCVMVFVLVYYFLMAALVWFVILAYSWHVSFKALGRMKENMESKSAYFHLAAWSLPLVLTITTLALGEVYADSSAGVCFVGTAGGNPWGAGASSIGARFGLVIVPVMAATISGGYFLLRCLVTLVQIQMGSQDLVPPRAAARIQAMAVRIALFLLGVMTLCVLTLSCHLYEYNRAQDWFEALHRSIICHALEPHSSCLLSSQPSLSAVQLHLLTPFLFSALVSTWLINSKSRETWFRVLMKRSPCCIVNHVDGNRGGLAMVARTDGEVLERGAIKELNLQKHKVIARAFAKRRFLHEEGRLSISFRSSHGDPVGLAFELDSQASSRGFSSAWVAALPQLVTRRGAIAGIAPGGGSMSSVRRNSIDSERSEVSYSVRRVSMESRRNSIDSQISLQISELTARHQTTSSRSRHKTSTHMRAGSVSGYSSTRRRDKRRHWGSNWSRTKGSSRVVPSSRRGSISSQDSQIQQVLSALQMAGPSHLTDPASALGFAPSPQKLTHRRAGNAGIEGPSPSLLARLRLPGQSDDMSDDDDDNDDSEQIEMLALTGGSQHNKVVEITSDPSSAPANETVENASSSTGDDSSSSFSPELSQLAARLSRTSNTTRGSRNGGERSHPNSRPSSHKKSSAKSPRRNGSKLSAVPKSSSRKSQDRMSISSVECKANANLASGSGLVTKNSEESETSSNSDDEHTVFLPKETKVKCSNGSLLIKDVSKKETREIGVQTCIPEGEIIVPKKSSRRKKGLNNSYNNAHRLVSELVAQNSRSKSAGNMETKDD